MEIHGRYCADCSAPKFLGIFNRVIRGEYEEHFVWSFICLQFLRRDNFNVVNFVEFFRRGANEIEINSCPEKPNVSSTRVLSSIANISSRKLKAIPPKFFTTAATEFANVPFVPMRSSSATTRLPNFFLARQSSRCAGLSKVLRVQSRLRRKV